MQQPQQHLVENNLVLCQACNNTDITTDWIQSLFQYFWMSHFWVSQLVWYNVILWECFHGISSHFRLLLIAIVQILASVMEMEMPRWLKHEQSLDLNELQVNKKLKSLPLAGYTNSLLPLCFQLILFWRLRIVFLWSSLLAHQNLIHHWLVQ